jgi:hypothetical protein
MGARAFRQYSAMKREVRNKLRPQMQGNYPANPVLCVNFVLVKR